MCSGRRTCMRQHRWLAGLALAVLGLGALAALPIPSAAEEPKAAEDEGHYLVFLADCRPLLLRVEMKLDGKPLVRVWNAFISDLFDRADTNKDGVLDENELAKAPSAAEI